MKTSATWPNAKFLISALVAILSLGLFLTGCTDEKENKVFRVGVLSGAPFFATTVDGFKSKLTEQGYIEGKNIVYDIYTISTNDAQATKEVLNKLVADKVDLIFTFPTGSVIAAKAATHNSGIPIVFTGAILEGNDLVESARKPGANITGVQAPTPEMSVKRLEILLRMAPHLKNILLLHNPNYTPSVAALAALRATAGPVLGVKLLVKSITSVDELKIALQAIVDTNKVKELDGMLVMPEVVVQSPTGWELTTAFANQHNILIGGSLPHTADRGALFSFFPDNIETGEMAALLASNIFSGVPAGTIPVFTAESRLRINYKLALERGLTLDEGLLLQAKDIIR